MSIIQRTQDPKTTEWKSEALKIDNSLLKPGKDNPYTVSDYRMTQDEIDVRAKILYHFTLGDVNMQNPRPEFNDLSVLGRRQVDQMKWNVYQPNNGQAPLGVASEAWRSNAMRPVTRNKAISIAAHATARLIFPKIFAWNEESDEQNDAATVMEDLMEWAADQCDYGRTSLYAVVTALTDPASIIYSEYGEVYRNVKKQKDQGKWKEETILDDVLSGFKDTQVPTDELYIENFYEPDIQKQGWLIWRRVYSYTLAESKYRGLYPNFKYIRPGVQIIYNDANQTFYQIYDPNMRQEDVEEVIYWNRNLDLKIIMVNGVMLTDHENPNPRQDKLYPFTKFGYEIINSRCFYYKSLVFKLMQDDNLVNTLYPMIVDGAYLNIMPPLIVHGAEKISSDVFVPGAVTTLSSPDGGVTPLTAATLQGLQAGMNTLEKVESSITESSDSQAQPGQTGGPDQTAYEISVLQQNSATNLGLFIRMISDYVLQYGKLRMGDILQYMTIPDVTKLTDDSKLVYKTFLMRNKQSNGKTTSRKIKFDLSLPSEPMDSDTHLGHSYDTLQQEGGVYSKQQLYRVNPELFRDLKYMALVSPDVLNPRSEELENAYKLETYDRAINNPVANQEEIFRDLLLGSNPITKKNPDKYMNKPNPMQGMNLPQIPQQGQAQQGQGQTPPPSNQSRKSPVSALMNTNSPMQGKMSQPMPQLNQ